MTRAEQIALRGLRKDPSIAILRADKRNATVVMDTADYKKNYLQLKYGSALRREEIHSSRSELNTATIKLTMKFKSKLSKQMSYRLNPKIYQKFTKKGFPWGQL